MNVIIRLPEEFVTSTTPSVFLSCVEKPLASSDVLPVGLTIATHADVAPSPRTGQPARRIAAYEREKADPQYRARMERARALLAEDVAELIPDSLAKLRLSRGMSQSQLAAALGTSQPHIAKIEAGSVNLYWHTAVRIADALAVSLDDLRPLVEITQAVPQEPIISAS